MRTVLEAKRVLLCALAVALALDGASLLTALTPRMVAVELVGLTTRPLPPLSPVASAAMARCTAARGRGVAAYAALPGARLVDAARGVLAPEDSSCGSEALPGGGVVTHCCIAKPIFQGRSGNVLTQYAPLRLYAEINSCAMARVVFTGRHSNGEMGEQADFRGALQWPPAGLLRLTSVPPPLSNAVDALALFSRPSGAALDFAVYSENSNWQFAALSLGWDLAGDTLIGRGVRGINAAVISGNATAERCGRWAVHREACELAARAVRADAEEAAAASTDADALAALAANATLEALHPWTASRVREAAAALLRGTAPGMTPALRAFVAARERTLVVHIRTDDVYRRTLAHARVRAINGVGTGPWVGHGWDPPTTQDTDAAAAAAAAAAGESPVEVLEMLESSAGVEHLVTPPLSYFLRVLRSTRSAWDAVLVVGDATLASSPLFGALRDEFSATLQSGSVVLDFATLVLARQLVMSGASTFTFAAVSTGVARVIHAPLVGFLVPHAAGHMNTVSCLLPHVRFDDRWVFHDVFRSAVGRAARVAAVQAAAALAAGLAPDATVTRAWARAAADAAAARAGIPPQLHLEWWRVPLAPRPERGDCPTDADIDGARGLARALGTPPPSPQPQLVTSAPLFFLTFDEVMAIYRNPACVHFLLPTLDFVKRAAARGGAAATSRVVSTCIDDAPIAALHDVGPSYGCRTRSGPCSDLPV